MPSNYLHLDPFLSAGDAENMLSIAQSFGSFGTYSDEATSDTLGEELPQRFDVVINYMNQGLDGAGNSDPPEIAASRTNYFRETYAYGNDIKVAGIEAFLEHPELSRGAQLISGCSNVVPAIVYANLLIPGQELAIHTDVPEFRGANRKSVPQWLLVVMLHSGLFEKWRIPIVTCVSWFGDHKGGAFSFYPDGADGEKCAVSARHNSAILTDTDTTFHGVQRVTGGLPDLPRIGQAARLHFCGGNNWELRDSEDVIGSFSWSSLRYSISWKAYCFEDDEAEALWRSGIDTLSIDEILSTLEASLRERGLLKGFRPSPTEFALLLVSSFVTFPAAAGCK